MKIFKVKILFTTPKKFNLFSWIIRKRLNTKYSHVAICVYLRSIEFWDVYEASHGNVHIISLERFKESNTILKEFNFNIDKEQFKSGIIFLKKQLQKKYSVLGAIICTIPFLRKLGISDDNDKKFICSELASRFVEEAKIIEYNKIGSNSDYITPKQFEDAIKDEAR